MMQQRVTRSAGTLRQEFAEVVRDRIRAAALSLFTERGYRATTVRQIAVAAGTTPTTLYKYYPTKEAITFGLLDQIAPVVQDFHAQIADLIIHPDAFDRWFMKYSAFWFTHRAIYHAFWDAALSNRKITSSALRRMHERIDEILEPAGTAIQLNVAQRERLGLWLLSIDSLLGLLDLATEGSDRDRARQNRNLADLLRSSLAGIIAEERSKARGRSTSPAEI